MLDLAVRNANLPDGCKGLDIGVKDGRIVEVAPAIKAAAGREIDATGRLVTPPFVAGACAHRAATSIPGPGVGRGRWTEICYSVRATRNPMTVLRTIAPTLRRVALRTSHGARLHGPPRTTRDPQSPLSRAAWSAGAPL